MENFPPDVKLRFSGSIHTPNVEEGLFVLAPLTEPSDALYMGCVSDRSKRRDVWSDVREGSVGCVHSPHDHEVEFDRQRLCALFSHVRVLHLVSVSGYEQRWHVEE